MNIVKSSFFRLFMGGFLAGIVGVVALQPVEADLPFATPAVAAAPSAR